ncbi:O-methyltransferase [Atopomonas sediminilitoris]|uniref:O-methyltransferase n=1 Tax=Atopomonas sediminilitoris TaxID=2919919 RepID=UPI001F4EA27E|nr:class I SAM-dependent methyltransferase [Atopomonas sediminilitoris]MCJ8168948.1 class I SAM-dependent methyltransferase [Atopomonas sediminilitoris]
MSNRTLNLDDSLYHYLCAVSLRETPWQRQLRDETASLTMARMQIAPEQGQFMALLLKLIGAKRVIEVGTFTGYSALCMAEAVGPDGYLLCCDVSAKWTAVAQRYWQAAGLRERIELCLAPAEETLMARLKAGEAGQYDAMFIDADKTSYAEYVELGLSLVRPGGVIMLDNTLWSGRVLEADSADADTRALQSLNKALHADARIDLSLLPVGDGLTLCRKR